MDYLLDTNIVLIYTRESELSIRIQDNLNLFSPSNNVALSVVSVGEIMSIAKQLQYGQKKINRIEELLNQLAVIDINMDEIIQRYAEIDAYSQGKLAGDKGNFTSRNMGKNDLWIAATSSVYNLELITTDRDFDHLQDKYLSLNRINLIAKP